MGIKLFLKTLLITISLLLTIPLNAFTPTTKQMPKSPMTGGEGGGRDSGVGALPYGGERPFAQRGERSGVPTGGALRGGETGRSATP